MAALSLCLVAPAVTAPPPRAEPSLEGRVKVTVRYVDVVVTDRSGDPITGLVREDFEVYEDGVRQEITDFAARAIPPDEEAGVEPAQAPRRDHPYVVLLFDAKHMSFGEIDRPKRAAQKLLDGLLTSDTRAALLVLRDQLESVADFTTDHDAMKRKVERILWWDPRRGDIRSLSELPLPKDENEAREMGELHISLYPSYAELGPDHALFGVLEALGRGLKPLSGPKTVVLFSEGISASIDEPRVAAAYRRAIGSLNDGNVSVVSVDAEGLRGRLPRSDRLFRALPQVNLLGGEGKSSLRAVAQETGGDALIGSNNMAGFLHESMTARQAGYVIGYAPVEPARAGAYRKLAIKVSRRGARVTTRRGFRDERQEQGLSPEAIDARLAEELSSWVLWRDMPLRMVNVPFPLSGKDSLVLIAVEMDAASLRREGRAEADLAGALVEARSRNVHDWRTRMTIDLAGGVDRIYYLKVKRVPWGTYVSKSVARGRRSGSMASSEIRLEVPRLTRIGPMMSPLCLFDPDDPSPIVLDDAESTLPGELATFRGRTIAPSFDRVFVRGGELVVGYGIWGLQRERRAGATRGEIVVTLKRAGKRIREMREEWRRADGRGAETLQPLTTGIDLAELAAGEYEVEARVVDRLVPAEAARSVSLTVRDAEPATSSMR